MTVPRFPVYIVSKGRWESRLTSKALERLGVPYRIVVEPQEYAQYAAVIAPDKILTLPFANLGQGSIPARNWIWEHAKSEGAEWHWILDDNIRDFYRYNRNETSAVTDGAIFRAAEDFVLRYKNVAQAGFHYEMFMHWTRERNKEKPAFYLNTRIYSCILLRTDLPHRWRGRYNEDTDLSLRVLKDGWCTVLFCAFCCAKQATMTMKGGNTEELYAGEGRALMAQSLAEQHPDVVTVTTRWGRPQHFVNYAPFKKNRLCRINAVERPPLTLDGMPHEPKSVYREQHPELFDAEQLEYWKAEWDGMPEYTQALLTPFRSLTFHFRNETDVLEFAKRVGMKLTKGRSFWFPDNP